MKAKAFVTINKQGVVLNDEAIFTDLSVEEGKLPFNSIYKELGISYPKFHKMDNLSKLGFLAVEILKMKVDLKKYESDRVAQLFMNSYSSLDTDLKHQESINANKMASPAVFVYTLPNIVMGEIAIRNGFFGENLFILADEFSAHKWIDLASTQLSLGKADAIVGGWIELFENNFDLRLYLIDKDGHYQIT